MVWEPGGPSTWRVEKYDENPLHTLTVADARGLVKQSADSVSTSGHELHNAIHNANGR